MPYEPKDAEYLKTIPGSATYDEIKEYVLKKYGKQHTVLTFYLENKTVYLELTPQSGKPWYGKELIFNSERSFVDEYSKDGIEVIDVTDSVLIGERPDFLLSRMV